MEEGLRIAGMERRQGHIGMEDTIENCFVSTGTILMDNVDQRANGKMNKNLNEMA